MNAYKQRQFFFLTVPPYDPDSQLDTSSLCRLEAATGMKVMMPIVKRLGQFNTDFHFRLEGAGMRLMTWAGDKLMDLTPPYKVEDIILLFLETMEPKTWRTLYSILKVLDMEGVVEEIEFYLSSKCQWKWVFLCMELVAVHGRSHPFSRCEESEGAVYLSDRVWLVGAVGTGC